MTEALHIVRLSPDSPHVATVAGWTHAAWGHLHPGRTFEATVAAFAAECGEGGVPSVFMALVDDERTGEMPVGTASLVADDMSDRPELTPWLASVFVHPEWRGQGIASRLVRRVEVEARAQGIAHFYLYTPDQQALYRRLGWRDREARTYRGEAVTIMLRHLDVE